MQAHALFSSGLRFSRALLFTGLILASRPVEAGYQFVQSVGTRGSEIGQFKNPGDAAVDSSGNVWVVDVFNNRIQQFSSNGAFISQFGSVGSGDGKFQYPNSLTLEWRWMRLAMFGLLMDSTIEFRSSA